jgi:hypothetical protein
MTPAPTASTGTPGPAPFLRALRRLALSAPVAGALLVPSPGAWAQAQEPPPERIFVEGRVWTGDDDIPAATAFAVEDGRFIAVGSDAGIRALAGPETEVVSLEGRRVVPGFNDAHWHFPSRPSVSLEGAGTVVEIRRRLTRFASGLPPGAWLVGRGWTPTAFPGGEPHRRSLDDAFPDRPVVLTDRDGHQALVNRAALERAGIDDGTPDPEDGRIVRGPEGRPTGLLQEAAAGLVRDLLPRPSAEEVHAALLAEMEKAASFGITSVQNASSGGLGARELAAIRRALDDGTMTVRWRAAVPFERDPSEERLRELAALRDAWDGPILRTGIAKGMLDGTVDAKTAAMLEPYVGGGTGLPMWTREELDRAVAAYDRAGLQVQLHAIGDRAIRMALDAFEHARAVNGPRDHRHRIEHVEVPAEEDLPRFRELGVVASTQAVFATPDATALESYARLLGPERMRRANNFRQFDEAGAVQAFGSDYPVFTMDPLRGIWTAVTRQLPDGTPPGGWNPEGRISVEAALRHYTRDAAWAEFAEEEKGRIAPGLRADFVVLSHDIVEGGEEALAEARVLETWLGGRRTFPAQAR